MKDILAMSCLVAAAIVSVTLVPDAIRAAVAKLRKRSVR